MRPPTKVKIFAAWAALCVAVAWQSMESAQGKKPSNPPGGDAPYALIDLGGFTGGDFVQSTAVDVNNPDASGVMQVVGSSIEPVPGSWLSHAAMWDVTGEGVVLDLVDVHPLDYTKSVADEVNDWGHAVVGDYIWVSGLGLVTLPGLGGGDTDPGLLNDAGDIIGTAVDASGVVHFAYWHIDQIGQISGPIDLGPEGDLPYFNAFDMNNHGVMAGHVGYEAAIIWFDETGAFQYQLLGSLDPGEGFEAVAINDANMVVGNATNGEGHVEAFLRTAENGMMGLGSLGGIESWATDINNQGQVVGWSDSDGRFSQVAFLWQDGQMFDLNQITDGAGRKNWLQRANGINDTGHIVGEMRITKPVSENHAFLAAPTLP